MTDLDCYRCPDHIALLVAFQVDMDAMLGNGLVAAPATLLGVIGGGGTLAVVMRFAPQRQRGPRLQTPWAPVWCVAQ